MKILVCFKVVPEFERVVDADWEGFSLDTELAYVKRSFGCFDETALETALLLKDSAQNQTESVECAALTLGPLPSPFRKGLYAAGFAHVWNVEAPEKHIEFQPRKTAGLLAYAIQNLITAPGESRSFDLILAGRQAGYADSGMVPLLLAEHLHIPVITEAERLVFSATAGEARAPFREIEIERQGEAGRERVKIHLPAVVVMGNSPVAALRAATLAAQMQATKRQSETLPQPDASAVSDSTAFMCSGEERPRLSRALSRKNCRFLSSENTPAQNAKEIERYLQEWGNL